MLVTMESIRQIDPIVISIIMTMSMMMNPIAIVSVNLIIFTVRFLFMGRIFPFTENLLLILMVGVDICLFISFN